MRAKLKGAIQEERLQKWKQVCKNLLGNPSEITFKPIQKIINFPLDIKLGQFTVEELDLGLKRTEICKTRKFTYYSSYAMLCINKTQ